MNEIAKIPIRDLPEDFTKAIHAHIRLYSITMLMSESTDDENVVPCSGTLCTYGSKAGILTARHVWDEARKHKLLIVMTERGPLALKTCLLVPASVPQTGFLGDRMARVPDISFLYLDPKQKSAIESLGKVFYSIAKRAESPRFDSQAVTGYWAISGNPQELLRAGERTLHSMVFGTNIAPFCQQDGWDYLVVDLDIPDNPGLPRSFGGVSGGGVWRTVWGADSDQTTFCVSDVFEDCILFGVSFYQTGGWGSKVIAHGPNSIYDRLRSFL